MYAVGADESLRKIEFLQIAVHDGADEGTGIFSEVASNQDGIRSVAMFQNIKYGIVVCDNPDSLMQQVFR